MKKDIVEYVSKCLTCQQIKVPEAHWIIATIKRAPMKMGGGDHGFH